MALVGDNAVAVGVGSTARINPITERLEQLTDQWLDFAAADEARLLCWLVAPDEHAMIDAFFAVEDDERTGQTRDLFIPLQASFRPGSYGGALLAELAEKAAALHAGLGDPTIPAWKPPTNVSHSHDAAIFLHACQSFIDYCELHHPLTGLLAIALTPADVADREAFRQWLDLVVRAGLPKLAKLRLVVRDDRAAPALAALVQAHPGPVVAVPADLDMPAARMAVSEQAGNLDKPGGQYRHAFVQMTNALGKGDLSTADSHASAAVEISKAQGWFALAVPIHLAMGAALVAAGKPQEANRRYLDAEAAANEGEKAGDPVSKRLRVQARVCRGSLLIHAGAWNLAATLFAETIPLATASGDPGMTIDCHRLAGFCHEQTGQTKPAWQHGVDGLAFARTVDKKSLATTTLAYLGLGLERVCKHGSLSGSWPRIEQELVSLLGSTWRPVLPAGAATPAKGTAPAKGDAPVSGAAP